MRIFSLKRWSCDASNFSNKVLKYEIDVKEKKLEELLNSFFLLLDCGNWKLKMIIRIEYTKSEAEIEIVF